MRTDDRCPELAQIDLFALGQLWGEEAEVLETHLTRCSLCAQRLASPFLTDPLLEAVRKAREEDAHCSDLELMLMRQLKRLHGQETVDFSGGLTAEGPPSPGEVLEPARSSEEIGWLGPYRVHERLGAGGMGVVFRAEDPRLKRELALKVIKPELVFREDIRLRFLREAEIIAQVEHENIVAIYDIGEQHGLPYLVMPLLRGESLEELLRRKKGPLEVPELLEIGSQIAQGLAAAHSRGLVHRDIKPANIYLCQDGRVKVLDFGLARVLGSEGMHSSQFGAIVGTPAYMAPEQAAGRPVDSRADLFGLGCVFYRMATGKLAFEGPDTCAILVQVTSRTPDPVARLNPALPAFLGDLIGRLLAKKPEDRPASAAEVVMALAELRQPRPSRRRWLVVAAGGALSAVGLSAWLAAPPPQRPSQPEPPAPAKLTLELDEPATRLVLMHGETEEEIEVKRSLALERPAGDYELRSVEKGALRQPVPARLVLESGQQRTWKIRLVGQIQKMSHMVGTGVWAVGVSPAKGGEWVISAGDDRRIGFWDLSRSGTPRMGAPTVSAARSLAFTPDGATVASGGSGRGIKFTDTTIRLWDIQSQKEKGVLEGHETWVTALAFSPDGSRLASGGTNEGIIHIWDPKFPRIVRTLRLEDGEGVQGLAYTPDGKYLLSGGGEGRVILWDASNGKLLAILKGPTASVTSVSVAFDGMRAISSDTGGAVWVWDLAGGKGQKLFQTAKPIRQVVFTPDGKRILIAGSDGKVRLIDATTGKEVQGTPLSGHGGSVNGVACVSDGRRAVSCGSDGTVRLWELPE